MKTPFDLPSPGRTLTAYSLGHFLTDFICALTVISLLRWAPEMRWYLLLLYNFAAFALQMPLGLIADRLDRNAALACAGMVLVTLALLGAVLIPSVGGLPALTLALLSGVGNGMFHVGGGVEILNFSQKRQWPLGVFVSPGALGLFFGTTLAHSTPVGEKLGLPWPLALGCVSAVAAAIALIRRLRPFNCPCGNAPLSMQSPVRHPGAAFALLFCVVVLRSYVGQTLRFSWKTGWWSLIVVIGVLLGKAAGGRLADRLGCVPAALFSLLSCALLLLFPDIPLCGTLAILFFNMTMPMTLWAMARLFPGAKGFAFGTLTFALFLGLLPDLLALAPPFSGSGLWYAAEALISLALLVPGLILARSAHREGAA